MEEEEGEWKELPKYSLGQDEEGNGREGDEDGEGLLVEHREESRREADGGEEREVGMVEWDEGEEREGGARSLV